jgi:hypothetical protein
VRFAILLTYGIHLSLKENVSAHKEELEKIPKG